MTLDTRPQTRQADASQRAGTTALVLGILFVVSTALVYVMSLTGLVDAPNWVRALAAAGIPLGFFGTPLAYTVARTGPGRGRGRAGLALAALALVAFVALEFAMG